VFSAQINELVDELIELRVYIEAAIDFVDEEIDFLSDGVVAGKIDQLQQKVQKIQATANRPVVARWYQCGAGGQA